MVLDEHMTLGTNSEMFACMQMIVLGHGCAREMAMHFTAVSTRRDL